MKIKILDREFNDKSFWMMFDPPEALDYFVPNHTKWAAQGITFTLEDRNIHEKYMRHIEVWAEGDEKVLNLMILTGV